MRLEEFISEERDPLLKEVARFLVTSKAVSIGAVQERFHLGFRRADSIMFQLAQMGIIPKDYLATNHAQPIMTEEELVKWMRQN